MFFFINFCRRQIWMSVLSTMAAVSTCAPTAQMEAIIAPVTEVFFFIATENNAEVNYKKNTVN